jgi:phosphatidyl-myo-inositol dimannoside synthase
MKKTLLLTHEYYPYHGGIARYCYNLFERLPSIRYVVVTDQKINDRRVPVIRKRLISTFMRPSWLKGVSVIKKIVKEQGIECILTPNILPLGNIAQSVSRQLKIPYVISLHGLDINLGLANKKAMTVSILKGAKHIIVNSKATKMTVDGLKLDTPVSVITPYLDEEKLTVDSTTAASLLRRYGKKKIILTVGRLVKRKGQDTIIKVMPDVLRKVPDAHYCVVGNGPEKAYLEQCITQHHVEKSVDIITDVPDSKLGAYYEHASLFAMPTRAIGTDTEGFGIVFLEAAHFGLPIISGRSAGETEAIGGDDCGVFVDGENLEHITEAIIHLLQDRELAQFLGRNTKQHLRTIPTWKDHAKVLESILS